MIAEEVNPGGVNTFEKWWLRLEGCLFRGAGNLATFNPVFGNFLRGCVLIND